jgi:hypothetical protein
MRSRRALQDPSSVRAASQSSLPRGWRAGNFSNSSIGLPDGSSSRKFTVGPTSRGRWAIERLADGAVIGGLAIRLLPPRLVGLEISFQLRPEECGNGYATEAAGALVRWAFTQNIGELYAVALPSNARAIATLERLGMRWVGETAKYYDGRTLQVHRIRPGDLADS